MPTTGPEWADPGPRSGGRYDWNKISQDLYANPGEWMRVFVGDNVSYPNAIRAGSISFLRDNIQVRTRANRQGEHGGRICDLYLRYVPEEN